MQSAAPGVYDLGYRGKCQLFGVMIHCSEIGTAAAHRQH
jgi:hypothetical protein